MMTVMLPIGFSALAAAGALLVFRQERNRIRQREFIREYAWPPGLLDRLQARHEWFSRKNSALVAEGLRQYFLAYQMSGCRYVAMPSQVADDLWHEFILYTRAYEDFCQKAFGRFFHHTPAEALSPERRQSNEGLRRVWWQCCKQENIHPVRPSRLPLLFALDKKLNIANGFHYTTDCSELRKAGVASSYCGGDFSDPDFGGSTAGMGDSVGGLSSEGDSSHGGHGGDGGGGGASGDFGGGGGDGGGGHGGNCGGGSCGGGSCGGGGGGD